MRFDIDELSTELSKEIAFERIEKALPPKLLYRWRNWMRRMRTQMPEPVAAEKFEQAVNDKFDELVSIKTLAKNEAQASFYENGIVKMDFGSDIDPKVKEAAMRWAKKKGLKAIEANLQKSIGEPITVMFAADGSTQRGQLVKCLRWSV